MKNTNFRFTWKIGGEAGFGIKSAGLSFAKALMRAGYETFDYSEYPSLIRGGHNTYQVTVSEEPIKSTDSAIDILVALNKTTIDKHVAELVKGAVVLYDGSEIKLGKIARQDIQFLSVPFKEMAAQTGGDIMRNTVAMGATMAVINLPLKILAQVTEEIFAGKPQVIENNLKAIELGYEYVKKHHNEFVFKHELVVEKKPQRMLIPGNEALSMGALAAGLNFFAAYPMTPATSVLTYLAAKGVEQGVVVKHAEDEISVINMALGAAHVGARAMVATSGGGFALMSEGLGLAAVSETPLVLINVQRPGSATGMPTWTDQGDLRFVLHAGQGEFPRIILAPGDVDECFYMAAQAFNLAEKYQTPVIILSDKFLAEGSATVPVFDEKAVEIDRGKLLTEKTIPASYRRYRLTADGVSPRALPGMKGGIYHADSYEHSEYGFSSEDMGERIEQVNKRAKKLEAARQDLDGATLYGSSKALITLVGWGSVKGPIIDALNILPEKISAKFNFLHVNVIWPLPSQAIKKYLNSKKKLLGKSQRLVLVENNSEAQLAALIRQETGVDITERILRYDGRPFFANELAEDFKNLL
ncbi:MAG: 2-oxoacid:acceptor oxidoreductase subunit alpha [bacterium]